MTVLEAIQKSAEFLERKAVESPRLQSELLLAHLLEMPRMKLYLNFERTLTSGETDGLRELIKRRGLREPLQHIIGSTSFCGLEMGVNRHVLVPRPETELLAEEGWTFLSRATLEPSAALDLGTGSGCIAIALAVKCPGAKITATDISTEALSLARENALRNGVTGTIEFLQSDGFEGLMQRWVGQPRELNERSRAGSPQLFDLIISNPPYIPSAEIAALQPEVRDYDPRVALDGGPDGLDFYRKFAMESKAWLKPGGRIILEFGDGQSEAVRKTFETENWVVEAVKEDYSHRARILIATIKPG